MLLGVALVGAALPIDFFSLQMNWRNPFAPLWMIPAALPGTLDACTAVMLAGEMVEHGNSFGAMVGLFCLGAGTNFATFAWLRARLGWRETLRIGSVLIGVVLAYGWVFGGIGYRPEHEEAHTHAFDRLGQRFRPGLTAISGETIGNDLSAARESHGTSAAIAAAILGLLVAVDGLLSARGLGSVAGAEPPRAGSAGYSVSLSGCLSATTCRSPHASAAARLHSTSPAQPDLSAATHAPSPADDAGGHADGP